MRAQRREDVPMGGQIRIDPERMRTKADHHSAIKEELASLLFNKTDSLLCTIT
jgi:hypothetical protein